MHGSLSSPARPADPQRLTTSRGAALYIGALLGPGLLLLPGLAAGAAGPASVLAWIALLGLSALFAVVFAALGQRFASGAGVIGYVAAGLGRRAGLAAGWSFLAGVVTGAPVVCLIGAGYITGLTGGGQLARAVIGGLLLLAVLALAAGGLRASAAAQMLLVTLLAGVIVAAVAGSAASARTANWTPFAPHGWLAIGRAAALLMLSFVGWEAVAPLSNRFGDPARQSSPGGARDGGLPAPRTPRPRTHRGLSGEEASAPDRQLARVIAIALAVTTALYLALAVTTIGVLGPAAATTVPLAGLLRKAFGPAGAAVAAVAAAVLTLGTTNAYINGAATMAGELSRPLAAGGPGAGAAGVPVSAGQRRRRRFLAAIAASGLALITLYGLGLVSPAALVTIPTTLFLAVYLGCMVAAVRILRGRARAAAVPAAFAVGAMLGYCGWALAAPALIALVCWLRPGWPRPGWPRPGWPRPGWPRPGWLRPRDLRPCWSRPGWAPGHVPAKPLAQAAHRRGQRECRNS